MLLLILFILGLFIGSFINVLADRLPFGKSVIIGRSQCDHCKHVLGPFDLIPLFSFLYLGGRCRYCKKKLSYWYPITEILSGLLLVLLWYSATSIIQYVLLCSIFLSMLGLFVADAKYHLLPDQLIIIACIAATILKLFSPADFLPSMLVGMVNSLSFLALILLTRGRGMGFGDVKLVFFIGFFLGFPLGFAAIYIAFLTGGFLAVILIMVRLKKFGQHIAFGPFLIIGVILSFFFQKQIVQLLQNYFNI